MQHVKITHAGRDSRLNVGFIYSLEHLQSGLLRLTSVGGRFSTLVNPDTSPVEFEYVDSQHLCGESVERGVPRRPVREHES